MSAVRAPERVAVLDIGKTNAKLVVLDCATGRELAMRRIQNRVLAGPPYPHYDIDALWDFALASLRELATEPSFDAISITTHGACAALLDNDGNLALPVLDYEHEYPQSIRQAYAALRPEFSETCSPGLSAGLNLGSQLHYQALAFPDAFARVRTILTYPQYWAYRLTGEAANEATSLGCHTDLWQPRTGQYSSLVSSLGMTELMAPVRSDFDALGTVLPDIAATIGLSRPVPVYCGIHDSNASLLAHLIGREPPFSVISTGTWVIHFAVGGDLEHLDPVRDTLANVDAFGRAVPSSRFMGGREFEQLGHDLGPFNAQAALAALPSTLAKQLMLLPNLAAGSGPFPGATGGFINDSGSNTAERWAAACLYMALMSQTCLDLVGGNGPVLVEGPFSTNPLYLAALRTLIARDVFALPGSTGTSQGAALLCGAKPPENHGSEVLPLDMDLSSYRAAWQKALPARAE